MRGQLTMKFDTDISKKSDDRIIIEWTLIMSSLLFLCSVPTLLLK